MAGIYRDVTLMARPGIHIADFFAQPQLDDDYRDGQLTVQAKIDNTGRGPLEGYSVAMQLYDHRGDAVFDQPVVAAVEDVNAAALSFIIRNTNANGNGKILLSFVSIILVSISD